MTNKSAVEMIAEVKGRIRQISVQDAMALQRANPRAVFLDVRDQPEVNLAKIPGAVHISRGTMEGKIEAAIPRDATVVIYCASGNRSAFAADTLQQMGYRDVCSMAGGIQAWAAEGGDVE